MLEVQTKPSKFELSDDIIRTVAQTGDPMPAFLDGEGEVIIQKQPIVSDFLITVKNHKETLGSVVIREMNKEKQSLVLGKNTHEDFRRRGITTELKRIVIEYMRENNLRYILGEIYLYKFASFLSNLQYRDRETGKAFKITIPTEQIEKIRKMIEEGSIDWDMSVSVTTDIKTFVDDNNEIEKLILHLKNIFDST